MASRANAVLVLFFYISVWAPNFFESNINYHSFHSLLYCFIRWVLGSCLVHIQGAHVNEALLSHISTLICFTSISWHHLVKTLYCWGALDRIQTVNITTTFTHVSIYPPSPLSQLLRYTQMEIPKTNITNLYLSMCYWISFK